MHLLRLDTLPRGLLSGDRETQDGRVAFLKAHPSLPLDARHFSSDSLDRLLARYDDLDEMTDGLLAHSENGQALNVLLEKYRERVKCVYIDPLYNTAASDFDTVLLPRIKKVTFSPEWQDGKPQCAATKEGFERGRASSRSSDWNPMKTPSTT